MLTIFGKAKELESQIAKMTAEFEAVSKENETFEATIKTLEAKIKDLESKAVGIPQDQHAAVVEENKNLTASVDTLKKEIETLKSKDAKLDKLASQKALEIVGQSSGVPLDIVPDENPQHISFRASEMPADKRYVIISKQK